MRRQLGIATLAIILGAILQQAHAIRPLVIYGDDDRLDYYQVADLNWQSRADSTVALIRSSNLDTQGAVTNIKTVAYGQSMGLCTTEPYYEQETAAFCSGFLVAPDTIVTAGHCVRSQDSCTSTKFVIGFRLEAAGAQPRQVAADQVYSCAQLVHSVANPAGEDFAVVKLDRAVTQVQPLTLRTQGSLAAGDALTVIGHPAGLPLKIAGGANVRSMGAEFLVANLDTYGGNSGSAVFNSLTGEVEGILVRGETDFVYKNGCRISNKCASEACRGEDVTLIERVLSYL
jgi:V8-like Glu-specific endopeptidase